MTAFANFLFINEITKTEIAEFLGVSNSFITKICKGEKNLPEEHRVKIYNSDKGWDTTPLEGRIVQTIGSATIGNHSNNNTQIIGENEALKRENELLKQLLEEKERTIQILMNK